VISLAAALDRVVTRLDPANSVELKLHARRYRVGGTADQPRIERWSGVRRAWRPLAPDHLEAKRVLAAFARMQWHKRVD
jgi:hypothetical protein